MDLPLLPTVQIYTDGSFYSFNKRKPGGWAAVILDSTLEEPYIISGSACPASDIGSMELTAIVRGLAKLKVPHEVMLYTDHKEIANLINGYSNRSLKQRQVLRDRYKDEKNRCVTENRDLFKPFFDLLDYHTVTAPRLRAHSGDYWNNIADRNARDACEKAAKKSAEESKLAYKPPVKPPLRNRNHSTGRHPSR